MKKILGIGNALVDVMTLISMMMIFSKNFHCLKVACN